MAKITRASRTAGKLDIIAFVKNAMERAETEKWIKVIELEGVKYLSTSSANIRGLTEVYPEYIMQLLREKERAGKLEKIRITHGALRGSYHRVIE
jgi:hypothetical protein